MRYCRVVSLFATMCAFSCLLAGCGGGNAPGGGSAPPVGSKGTIADLRGGWLITGPLPDIAMPHGTPYVFSLALNLDVIDGQVSGYGTVQFPCPITGNFSGSISGGLRLASASVASDGTFTLTDVPLPGSTQHQIVVNGKLPDTAGGVWSGTFTASAPLSSCNGVPPPNQAGSYTTQKVADLNGTFSGHTTLGNPGTAVDLTTTLTQGGPASVNHIFSSVNDQNVLSGSLAVQGVPCFKNGTVQMSQGIPEGFLLGNHLQVEFLMDDGSTVLLSGSEGDISGRTLYFINFVVSGGVCDKTSVIFTDSLIKQ